MIIDLQEELMFLREIMRTEVRDRCSPKKRAVETLLNHWSTDGNWKKENAKNLRRKWDGLNSPRKTLPGWR
jgi:hypothetical protein